MATDWEIKSRGHRCSTTDRQFEDGETFYTLLYREEEGFARQDLCVEAWKERDKERTPFSSWKSKYEVPPPPPPEALGKQTAETLLRHYMNSPGGGEGDPHANVRYILALMLERKRLLKPIDTKEEGDGRRLLIYEHRQSGEVFVIPDPRLHLDKIGDVQDEVSALLSAPAFAEELAAPAPPEPEGAPDAPETLEVSGDSEAREATEPPSEESAPEAAEPESEK